MPKTKQTEGTEKGPAFEDALAQLESLVREMESDQMPLEELIQNFEKGTSLFQVCEKRLDEAQGRIEIIRKNRNGENVVVPLEEGEAESSATPGEVEATEDHGELF